MFGLGTTELLVILVIALVIFGGSKLPELGSSLGKGIKNFKKGLSSIGEDDEKKGINSSGGQNGKKIEP
jgi:sec-independent protein translocase protein TatA